MLLYNKVTPYSQYMADTPADHSLFGHTHIPDASAPGGESALAFRPRTGGTCRKSCRIFFCNKITLDPVTSDTKPAQSPQKSGFVDLFKGKNLVKVLFSGIPWACEGVGAIGGVSLMPALLHAGGMVLVLRACIGD